MDQFIEKEFMQEHDAKTTKRIHMICISTILLGPALLILTKVGLIKAQLWACVFAIVAATVGWIVIDVLIRMKKHIAAKYIQLIYLDALVMVISAAPQIGIYMTLFAIPLLSVMYMDRRLTTIICGIGYVFMMVALYPRMYMAIQLDVIDQHNIWNAYKAWGTGYTMEYIFMTLFVTNVVRHVRVILVQFFTSQKERVSAEATSKAKTGFLANMSHEIRTPINAIIGMDEMILRESREIGIVRYATNIKSASKTLLALINDILDFSKIESGKMEIVEMPYFTSSLLNDLVTMIQQRADDKGLKFELDIDETIPAEMYGDEVRIRQIVTNLLTNAVKYSDKGTVTLKMRSTRIEERKVILDVAVIDTGIGIKPEDKEKLFETFTRVNEEHNHTIEGTGLGLPLTKQLLELMGSNLEVDSVYGEGSTFYFQLEQVMMDDSPLGDYRKMYEQILATKTKYQEKFIAPDASILVVDDTKMNLEVIKGLLKKTRIKIDTAESGFKALDMVNKKKYEMIFLDHKMPEMDGIQTLEAMKNSPDNLNQTTNVIALTANAVSGAREFYMQRGFSDYISKPVQSEILEQMIIDYLPPNLIKDAPEEDEIEYLSEVRMPDIEGIDVDEALTYTGGNHGDAVDSLRYYVEEYDSKYAALTQAYDNDDWKLYQINAHAVKSTSRTVGAIDLSDFAKIMEAAAAACDERMIETQHAVFMDQYKSLVERIKTALAQLPSENNSESVMKVLSVEELTSLLESIATGAENFDVDAINNGIEALDGVDIAASMRDGIKKSADDFDYDSVAKKAAGLKDLLGKF